MRTLSRYLLLITAGTLLVPAFASAADDATTPRPSVSPHVKVESAQFCSRFTDATGKLGTEDHDEGRVVSVEGDTAYVAWDSGIRTHVAVASLTKL